MIRYMIVEDEYILGYRLERMIAELRPEWKLVCRTAGVEESIDAIRKNEIDIIFMDIELSDGNCFEIFDNLEIHKPVVFTTAYDDYALQAFKADCVEYLLKPITQKDLQGALDKLDRLSNFPRQIPDYTSLKEHVRSEQAKHRILIPEGSGYIFVKLEDVAWFLKNDRYTDLRTFSGQSHLIDRSLDNLENEVDKKIFFRTSRNCMVNIDAIVSIQRFSNGRLKLITNPPTDLEILVSQARREDFLNWIEGDQQI